MEILLAAGGIVELREATILDDVELARRICGQGSVIDIDGNAKFAFGDCYLVMAAELDAVIMIEFLLERGADIEKLDDLGRTALMRAAWVGHARIVDVLLDHGADIDRGWPHETALTVAEEYGHQEVAKLLRSRGAKPLPSDGPKE
jgi:ankyrin repeat protein